MSTLSLASPEAAVPSPRHARPPMALERSFFVLDVPDGSSNEVLTNGQVLAMVAAHAQARWVVMRRWVDGRLVHYACPRGELGTILSARAAEKSFGTTLRIALTPCPDTLDRIQYRTCDRQRAVVLHDGVLLGVTVPWDQATRAAVRMGLSMREGDAPWEDAEFPHRLDALMPAQVPVNGTATLVVTLDRISGLLAAAADVLLHIGEPLEITVQGDSYLQPQGENSQPLAVPATEPSAAVRFTFRANAVGQAHVKIYAFRGAFSVARLVLPVRIVAEHAQVKPDVQVRDDISLAPRGSSSRSDLCLLVMEGRDELRFQLWAGRRKVADYEPVFARDLEQFSRGFAGSIEGLAIGKPDSAEIARRKLEAWGSGLFRDLVPKALQTLLWEQQEAITIQVCSDEAWIPWEACRLLRYGEGGRVEEGKFFAEAFAMTRWLHGSPAPDRLRMSRCALVVPSGSGLDMAEPERAYYLGLAQPGREVQEITARYLPLTEAMASGDFDAWHFCGHANAGGARQGDSATLRLEGNETMRADLFAGVVENALAPRPFIFFNACQSAMGGQSLTGVGGWAHRFIRPNRERHGAAAFVGTYWSVYDAAAHRFAKALYDGLCRRQPIGVAARDARRQSLQGAAGAADPLSWLAYTVYADPLAVLEAP